MVEEQSIAAIPELEEKYLALCNKYQSQIDSGLFITIRNKLISYTPSIKLSDNDLLSICPILSDALYLRILNFTKCHLSCNGVWLIYNLLSNNSNIIAIDLSHNLIKDFGAIAIGRILETSNSQLKTLALNYNQITTKGAQYIAQGLKSNTELLNLDLSHNLLRSYGARIIRESLLERESRKGIISNEKNYLQNTQQNEQSRIQCNLDGNSVVKKQTKNKNDSGIICRAVKNNSALINKNMLIEQKIFRSSFSGYLPFPTRNSTSTLNSICNHPSWSISCNNSISADVDSQGKHLQQRLQFFINFDGNFLKEEVLNSITHGLGFLLSILGCIVLLMETYHRSTKCWIACLIYSFTLFFMYLSSTLYHSFFAVPYIRHMFRILDYSSIFLFIAGTNTPLMLITFHHSPFHSIILFFGVWIIAIAGVCYLSVADEHEAKFKPLLTIFLMMSFVFFLDIKPFIEVTDVMAGFWLTVGCAFYIVGIYFLTNCTTNPMFHTIWHLCVIFGSVAHYLCILWYIVPLDDVQRPYEDLSFSNIADNVLFGFQISYLWSE